MDEYMTTVHFDYYLKKDAWSWVLIAKDRDIWDLNWRDQVAHIPDDLLEKIEAVSFSRAQKRVEHYIEEESKREYKRAVINFEMHALEQSWRKE